VTLPLTAILRDNVELTMGCTDPITPALAAAAARHVVGGRVTRICAIVSRDIFKGAFAVGVPRTGRAGIRIALLLGAAIGDPASRLMLFATATEQHVLQALAMLDDVDVEVIADGDKPAIYAHVVVWSSTGVGHATIQGRHDALVEVGHGDAPARVFAQSGDAPSYARGLTALKTGTIDDFTTAVKQARIDDLEPICQGLAVNSALHSQRALSSGPARHTHADARANQGHSWIEEARAQVAGGIEARMTGSAVPIVAVFGSGNQGIVLFGGLQAVGLRRHVPPETTARAGALAVLLAGAMNIAFERGSPFCDCVLVACPALAGASAWLLGAEPAAVSQAIVATSSVFTGLLCDGAKPSCAFRAGAGTSIALETASLAAGLGAGPCPAALGEGDWRRAYSDLAEVAATLREPAEEALVRTLHAKPDGSGSLE